MAANASASRTPALALAVPAAFLIALIAGLLSIALVFGAAPQGCSGSGAVGGVNGKVPARLAPIYIAAASRYELGVKGPAVLAAINFVETSFGTNVATSSAGASGWMAFMPETWAEWGVDADGDGVRDPYDPQDAIFGAANYLHDSGAPSDWHDAVFAYNHAEWYVEKVFRYARQFAANDGELLEEATSLACLETTAPNEAVAKMVAEAERLSQLRSTTEYVYGGSHGQSPTPANGPFDCSSAVSHLLQIAGFGNPTMDTIAFSSWGESGPGRWVTLHNKPYGGDAHIFIEFNESVTPPGKRFWGTSGFVAPGHGPGWIPESAFSAAYLSGFELRHPPGL